MKAKRIAAARKASTANEARLREVTVVIIKVLDAIAEANPRVRAINELTAAAILFGHLPASDRRLMLRQTWRLVPVHQRSVAALAPARRYAPRTLMGLESAGGAR